MASSITDPYSFLSESEITTDIFSSSPSIFYHLDFEESDKKSNSSRSYKSKYDFYSHIQTIHPDVETLTRLAPHRQYSQFIWATSFQISEQSFLFAIFIPFGLIIWKSKQHQQERGLPNEKVSEFYQIKPVQNKMATFIDCINSPSLIFTYENEKSIYIIHDVGNMDDDHDENSEDLIKRCDIPNTVRTFCQLSPEKALIITNDNLALIFDVPSLTKLKTFSYSSFLGPMLNPILKLNPIRKQNICDSIILTTSTLPSDYDEENSNENENYVISASYYHLSIFDNADSKDGSFTFRNTIETAIGLPKYVSVIGTTAFLMIKNEKQESDEPKKSNLTLIQIYDIYNDKSSPTRQITFESDEDVIAIIAVENDVCCVLTRYHLHLIIVSDITFQFSLVVSKSFNDFVFSGSLISDHTISILTAHEGNHIFEILPYEQLLRLIPYQINRVLAALSLFQSENDHGKSNPDYHDSISILENCDIDKEAFYETDKQKIVSLNHYMMIKDFLKIHLDLVRLFYFYITKKSQESGQEDEAIESELKSINEFEINAYDLICFNETVLYVGDSVSFKLDVLRNAITQRNLQSIFNCIKSDISTKHYNLLDFLIRMAESCFKEHYIPNEDVYLSSLKCHPELKILIDAALHSFKGQYKSISEHIDQYTNLCSLSFSVLDDEPSEEEDQTEHRKYAAQIGYAMELFKVDDECKEKAINCVEQIALDHTVIELMAWILHTTQLYVTKCNLYYDKFGDYIIMPILTYMLEQGWIADIFDIGEIPEWRPFVTELLTNADSLLLAFHSITEDGDELGKAAMLLWQSISAGTRQKTFTLDQAASLCSIALICCTVKLNEDPDKFSYLVEIKQHAQDQFMLLELQKTSKITDQNTVLTPDELIEYFISQKDYIIALSVYGCSVHERNEEQNANTLANIISLLAVSWKTPLTDGSLQHILVESRALLTIPNGLLENLERLISQFDKKNIVLDIVKSANQQTIYQQEHQNEEQEEE